MGVLAVAARGAPCAHIAGADAARGDEAMAVGAVVDGVGRVELVIEGVEEGVWQVVVEDRRLRGDIFAGRGEDGDIEG